MFSVSRGFDIYILGCRTHILRSPTRRLAWYFHILRLIELWFQICLAHQHAKWRGQNYFLLHFTELCIISEWLHVHRHDKSSGFTSALSRPENKTIKIKWFPQCLKTQELITNSCLWGKWRWGKSVYYTERTWKEFLPVVFLKWCVWGPRFPFL